MPEEHLIQVPYKALVVVTVNVDEKKVHSVRVIAESVEPDQDYDVTLEDGQTVVPDDAAAAASAIANADDSEWPAWDIN